MFFPSVRSNLGADRQPAGAAFAFVDAICGSRQVTRESC
jgi:hypothetical protein